MSFSRLGIMGAGAWGQALAQVALRAGLSVVLWGRGGSLSLAELRDCDALLLVVPAQAVRETLVAAVGVFTPRPLILCAKGIESGSACFMSEVAQAVAPDFPLAVLSGPSFAADVVADLPTAVTLAAYDHALACALADALQSRNFRIYDTDDVRGVEIGGAAKNVLAIGCGVAAGLQLGASACAALLARGFAELSRFGQAYGARPATLMGLSGLGDLTLTCSSPQSRNFAFGFDLGRGLSPADARAGKLVEGAFTAPALLQLARAKTVDMPITEAVAGLVAGHLTAAQAVSSLLTRSRKREE